MSTVERLKIALEEVVNIRLGSSVEWKENLDLEARTLDIGWSNDHDAQRLGRKLKNLPEITWEQEAEARAREQNMAPMPYPKELLEPLDEERINFYREEILRALLRQEAINTKF